MKSTTKALLGAAVIATSFGVANTAHAEVFNLHFDGISNLYGTDIVDAYFQVTTSGDGSSFEVLTGNDFTGTIDLTSSSDLTVSNLLNINNLGGNDNQFKATANYLTNDGISFSVGGFPRWNLFHSTGSSYVLRTENYSSGAPTAFWSTGTLSVTAVPEPETYAMLLAGLGVIGAMSRRKKAQAAAAHT
ncbi:protein of unknown function DUF1555 [Leptothrix cholodnii SP-6]|uniref:Ice-binding protein C-terminal domain-containing protein n=1 Tax=Leptothrix cholodnii (strain ATCC 51168 / LMG 8142 / SP-6) TaxID=395495 RepID=B1XX79_LEPCP|nr:FxDxF family PEP-CTERM protein [Leptothrix cholodnii]ACB33860.1 protein of unknown function DUF1555 [Leptothrix cholodnii SP-6]